jgi:hypothetical protein
MIEVEQAPSGHVKIRGKVVSKEPKKSKRFAITFKDYNPA